jgi:hypothetical protein
MDKKAVSKLAKRKATPKARARLRKKGESIVSRAKAERLAALETRAFRWIARGRAANLELGRVFLEIKAIVGHGRWERYYAERFGSYGVAQRTAQTYMERARKEDAISKTAESALFPMATDPKAQEMRAATEQARAEVAKAGETPKRGPVRRDGIYKLPLFLTIDEQDATDELRKSPDWPDAQKKIVALLDQLCIECGVLNEDALA